MRSPEIRGSVKRKKNEQRGLLYRPASNALGFHLLGVDGLDLKMKEYSAWMVIWRIG